MKNKSKKIILGLAGILTAIASTTVITNWIFLNRLLTYPDEPITNTNWYQPLETVPGNPREISQNTSSSISQDSLNKISDYAAANNSSALLVLHRGELILERYWQGFTADATFNSMSMSKTIVALLIGMAIADEDIKSELEPVANYIPEWNNEERQQISIQDLLYMQSGLQNSDNQKNPLSDLVQMYAGKDTNAIALNIPAIKQPQATFSYNNANTQILSQVLEQATGKTYADYLSIKLWQPIQAEDAYLWLDRPQGNPKVFCCLFATPRDWAKVGQLFLDRGRVNGKQLVDHQWLDKMLQPSPLESKYGYHIWLKARIPEPDAFDITASKPFLDQNTFYLDGASRQRVYIVPSQDLVIVRVGEEPEKAWDDSVLTNTLIADLQGKQVTQTPD